MKKSKYFTGRITAFAAFALLGIIVFAPSRQASALTLGFGQMFQLTTPKTMTFVKKIQFSQKFAQLISMNKLANIRFSPKMFRVNLGNCEEAVKACQQEFDACVGNIDQFDQAGYELLEKAKIKCQNSCEPPVQTCFGLYDDADSLNPPPPEPKPKQCEGPQTRSCMTADGVKGTQIADSCNTKTGEWNFGECKPSTPILPPKNICFEKHGSGYRTCTTPTGAPGEQFASYCDTVKEEWVWQECVALEPECQGAQPSCPSGYSGSYVCQNGQWVNQCQPPQSNCPELDPDWRVCQMPPDGLGVGRWGREYADYCNENTGEWVWKPCNVYKNLQPECTSFTYSEWGTCSNGNQYRTIESREPYGCAGGNPVTQQSCCDGAEPSCPSGWTGSYKCGNNRWYNTCIPKGIQKCYRGARYIMFEGEAYAAYIGTSGWNQAEGCRDVIQSGPYPIWNSYSTETNFKSYVDQMYDGLIKESCDPNFKYTQC
ncbi:hypothetical protein GF391_00610 [Candidatus Uhrbacteria bacterium]|nr:hypothetical protein [Candidatus Uhrbacteria bacterium]